MPVLNCDQVFAILTRGPVPAGEPTDDSVEAHLLVCARCRRFAEALRADGVSDPELLMPEESRALPYYWGIVAIGSDYEREMEAEAALLGRPVPERHSETNPFAAPIGTQATKRRRKSRLFERNEPLAQLNGWQLLFAVVMGAALGTVLRLIGYADESLRTNSESAAALAQAEQANTDQQELGGVTTARFDDQDRWTIDRELAAKLGAVPACWQSRRRETTAFHTESEFDSHARLMRGTSTELACCTSCHNASSVRFRLPTTTAKVARSCQVCHRDLGGHSSHFNLPQDSSPQYGP
jgi:hypothetical protein